MPNRFVRIVAAWCCVSVYGLVVAALAARHDHRNLSFAFLLLWIRSVCDVLNEQVEAANGHYPGTVQKTN